MTSGELFALAHGIRCEGPHHCFYCGAACGEDHPAAKHVGEAFTGRGTVARPASPWVCPGCVLSLADEAAVPQFDGTARHLVRNAMRSFSWLVTAGGATAGTKAHLDRWRSICLNPPPPPWLVVLADSGQKHLLYRGTVNLGGPPFAAGLEGERVDYDPADLASLVRTAAGVAAAAGKPALADPPGHRVARLLTEYHGPAGGADLFDAWAAAAGSPLGRLAAWLAPNRERSQLEFPRPV